MKNFTFTKSMKNFFLPALSVFLLMACSQKDAFVYPWDETQVIQESEPNDTTNAQNIGSLDGPKLIRIQGDLSSGTIVKLTVPNKYTTDSTAYTGDYDVYTFSVTQAGKLTYQLDWEDAADIDAFLMSANGTILSLRDKKDTVAAFNPFVAYSYLQPGTYRLMVVSKKNAAHYLASVSVEKPLYPINVLNGTYDSTAGATTYRYVFGNDASYRYTVNGGSLKYGSYQVLFPPINKDTAAPKNDTTVTFIQVRGAESTLSFSPSGNNIWIDGHLYIKQ